jgi:hypothetical protein
MEPENHHPLSKLPDIGRYQLQRNVHNITRYQTIAADMQHTSSKLQLYLPDKSG